jgi:membrane-associated phospholipid phosphatase
LNVDTQKEVSRGGEGSSEGASPTAERGTRLLGIPLPAAILIAGLIAFFALHPLDPIVEGWVKDARDGGWLGGDLRREWSALQQFGQGTSIALIALVIFLLDRAPHRRTRLLDYGLALALVGVTVTAMKWFIGRPRPKFGDPTTILWPWGTYPIKLPDGATVNAHAWDLSVSSHAQLWSLPSSHTAFAVVTALFLTAMYPRLRWVAAFLAVVVATGRLVFDAHWLTDVITGAAVAAAVAIPVIRGAWASRKLQIAEGQIAK